MVSLAVIAIALGGIAYWLIHGDSEANSKISSQPKVSEKWIMQVKRSQDRYLSKSRKWKNVYSARRSQREEDSSFRI